MGEAVAEILLVEDDQYDAELTMRVLTRYSGARHIEVAQDGVDALDYLFCRGSHATRCMADMPRLIVLDLKLPRLDGKAVLKVIKSDPRTRGIPVVVLTSSREECDLFDTYQLGVNSYIVKPVDFERFVDAIRQLGAYWVRINEVATPLVTDSWSVAGST